MTSVITFKNYSLWLNGRSILSGITTAFARGELVVLLGPSGAGKSTLGRVATGALRPKPWSGKGLHDQAAVFAGEVQVFGRAVSSWRQTDLARTVGTVAQKPVVLPGTVARNLMGVQRLVGLPGDAKTRKERALTALARSGLEGVPLDKPAAALSGGEQQRLTIARTLQFDPRAIVFDEPTSALDDPTAVRIVETILALRDQGVLVVLITHDNRMADLADRVIVLDRTKEHEGAQIIVDGPPDGALEHAAPEAARALVASFEALVASHKPRK